MRGRRWICGLLACVMILILMPCQSLAAVTEESNFLLFDRQKSELTVRQSGKTAAAGPALAEGNHEKWIDRIADLPDYASEFYTWLEDNATATGALTYPTKGELISGFYVHTLGSFTGSVGFTYKKSDNLLDLAEQASINAIGDLPDIVMEYVFEVYAAFDRDHPEVFWLDGSSMCLYGVEYGYSTVPGSGVATANYTLTVYFLLQDEEFDIRAEGYRDPSVISEAIQERDSNIDRILADCPTDTSVADQIRYLNTVLTQTNAYNSAVNAGNLYAASNDAWECVSALTGSAGVDGPVCEGYARAFKVLCDELNIPCVLVEGTAKTDAADRGEAHMWNYVRLGDAWYAVDVTWNDPYISGRDNGKLSGYETEDWLLLGSETEVSTDLTFLQSHPVSNVITVGGVGYTNGPVLAENAYVEADNLLDVSQYRSDGVYTAPERDGKVFAGWYTDAELTQPLGRDVTSGYAYAKFVDEKVLTLKWQVTNGTNADSANTNLRMLTSVDSLEYSLVSFVISFNEITRTVSTGKVYQTILAGTTVIRGPSSVFCAESSYFMTYTLQGVPSSMFDTDMTITPSWETLDGTVVTGIPRTFRISEAF